MNLGAIMYFDVMLGIYVFWGKLVRPCECVQTIEDLLLLLAALGRTVGGVRHL